MFESTPVHLYVEVDAKLEGGAAQVLRPVHLVRQPSDCHIDAGDRQLVFNLIKLIENRNILRLLHLVGQSSDCHVNAAQQKIIEC